MDDITIDYEEFLGLIRTKVRVETLTTLINRYRDTISVDQIIAILDLEVNEDA